MKYIKLFEEFVNEEEDDMSNRTELEMHVIRHFRDSEPLDTESERHVLEEFMEGYKSKNPNGTYVYAMGPDYEKDKNMLDKFIKIVQDDIEGVFNYNAEDCKSVIAAIEKFGL